MEFGHDKPKNFVLHRGNLVHSQNIILDFNREIQEFEKGKTKKYLGTEENDGIQY
jgi:hypothetical protein